MPEAVSGELSLDSELSQSEKEGGREVTVGDHFTFLGEVLELKFSSFLEPRKDDTRGVMPVWAPACSSTGRASPQYGQKLNEPCTLLPQTGQKEIMLYGLRIWSLDY